MEVSRTSINAASATVMAISQGFTLGFHGITAPWLGFCTVLAADAAACAAAGSISDKKLLLDGCRLCLPAAGEARPSTGRIGMKSPAPPGIARSLAAWAGYL
jgi:hypothetical protein